MYKYITARPKKLDTREKAMKTYQDFVNNTLVDHLWPCRRIRIWYVLGIVNLIVILLLTVFAGAVYHRIAIEAFSPPYYSIWVRPGEERHLVEFIVSPWDGFLMTIDGKLVFKI